MYNTTEATMQRHTHNTRTTHTQYTQQTEAKMQRHKHNAHNVHNKLIKTKIQRHKHNTQYRNNNNNNNNKNKHHQPTSTTTTHNNKQLRSKNPPGVDCGYLSRTLIGRFFKNTPPWTPWDVRPWDVLNVTPGEGSV